MIKSVNEMKTKSIINLLENKIILCPQTRKNKHNIYEIRYVNKARLNVLIVVCI